jgi:DNA-binding transcriptional ArsR family regulator
MIRAPRQSRQWKREKNIVYIFSRGLTRDVMLGKMTSSGEDGGSWTLLTGHGHVLVEIARNPSARMREIAAIVGLTERTVQAIVTDLEAAGYLTRDRVGRRNLYTINRDSLFRHSAQEGLRVGPFLNLLAHAEDAAAQTSEGSSSRP